MQIVQQWIYAGPVSAQTRALARIQPGFYAGLAGMTDPRKSQVIQAYNPWWALRAALGPRAELHRPYDREARK